MYSLSRTSIANVWHQLVKTSEIMIASQLPKASAGDDVAVL